MLKDSPAFTYNEVNGLSVYLRGMQESGSANTTYYGSMKCMIRNMHELNEKVVEENIQ